MIEIVMYTKSNCPNCMRAEFMFSASPQPVKLEKRNIEESNIYLNELKKLGSSTLPTIIIDNKTYIGFEENLGKLQEVFGL